MNKEIQKEDQCELCEEEVKNDDFHRVLDTCSGQGFYACSSCAESGDYALIIE